MLLLPLAIQKFFLKLLPNLSLNSNTNLKITLRGIYLVAAHRDNATNTGLEKSPRTIPLS
jgi:hypothetical protein